MKIVAFFIRHGETDLNKENSFRGDLDVPLNEKGHQQAEALVPRFAARDFSDAFQSDRLRVKQTMEPLMESHDMVPKTLTNLESLNTGDLAGQPKDEKNLELLKWYRNHPDEQIPGGETVRGFRDRVDPILMMIIRVGKDSGKPAVACVHGSIIKELGRLMYDDIRALQVEPGGVVAVFSTPNGFTAKPIYGASDEYEPMPGS